jgi:hypothetical protein
VRPIQPGRGSAGSEKLTSVRVWLRIRHRQQSGSNALDFKALIEPPLDFSPQIDSAPRLSADLKSPPRSIPPRMIRWKEEPLYVSSLRELPTPLIPRQRWEKLWTVFGATSP